MADMGAEVIKVESAQRPDLGRRLQVFVPDQDPTIDSSGYFNQWNQGKRSVQLSLTEPGAIEIVKELVAHCDVLVENFATGVMERLGLGYETLREIRPDLIMASISGYGETGPWREYMGYGPAISPLSGLSSLSGYVGEAPSEVGLSLGDPAAGITAAAAVGAARGAREASGGGQHFDVSLLEATAVSAVEGWMSLALAGEQPERMANRDPLMCPHNIYPASGEDEWVTIACASEAEWRGLCDVVEPALAADPRFASRASRKRHEDELDAELAKWTSSRTRWVVTRALQAVGVAAFPCMTPQDLVEDEHLQARGLFEKLDHPQVGPRVHAGIPWRLANGPNGVRAPAPLLGADTDSVLGKLLGYSPEKIQQLRDDKIVY